MGNAIVETKEFTRFLIKAKQNTYAGGGVLTSASRMTSKDLSFEEGAFAYRDSYLGDIDFIGEEAIWYQGKPVWGMNYYGRMLAEKTPIGFIDFLKAAMLQVPEEMPYRGPEEYREGNFFYQCTVEGAVEWFRGKEFITYLDQRIYQLYFHGGSIQKQTS